MRKKKVLNLIFVVIFIAIIAVPVVTTDFPGGKYSPTEQRNLAGFPVSKNQETGKFDISRTGIQNWISDNIGQRNNLIELCVNFKYKLLGQSTSEKVLIGKDGWLYYTMDNNIEIATGEYPLSEEDLKLIAENQQSISDYYKNMGISYVLMLTPSKVSIYPEYLPMSSKSVSTTPVDIVSEYLRENTDVIVYNSKDALLEAKNNGVGQLYHKTDTHWNEKGSYYVYRGLHKIMVENGILDDEPIDVTFEEGEYKGEFSSMLGSFELLPPETAPIANWNMNSVEVKEGELYDRVQRAENEKGSHQGANLYTNSSVKKLCAEIYGDSQIENVRKIPQYLSEHFSTFAKYSARNISITVDSAVNPDVVIFSCSERFIKPLLLQCGDVPAFADKNEIPGKILPKQKEIYNGMFLDLVNDTDLNTNGSNFGEISHQYYQNSDTVALVGWAADFNVNQPLSKLYLKIGEHILECNYGIERTSVSDYFQNQDLKMTGFSITFPKVFLEGVDKIEFIQVGTDGTYRFEAVTYMLSE